MPENYIINRNIHLPLDQDYQQNVKPKLQTGSFMHNNGTTIDALPIRDSSGNIISWRIQHWPPIKRF